MEETSLTQKQIVRAATNDPALSDNKFTLGDREFTVVDLPYKQYLAFFTKLQPLLEAVLGKVAGKYLTNLDATGFKPADILKYCADDLPELACMVCAQSAPGITVEEVTALARSPFKMASVVVKQIVQNNMVEDITDFFGQVLPLIKAARKIL